jgi:DivIVA domain-containing protein
MADLGRSPRDLSELASAFGEWTATRSAPDAIRSATFPTVRKGYDPKEVSAFLERVAADMERLQNRTRQLEAAANAASAETRAATPTATPSAAPATAAPEGDGFTTQAAHIAELMRRFDEDVRVMRFEAENEVQSAVASARAQADDIRREARMEREEAVADAAAVVAQAQTDAERMQREAQARADELAGAAQRTLRDAETQADEILRAVSSNREAVVDDVRRMREQLVITLARLDAIVAEREDADRLIVVDESRMDDPRFDESRVEESRVDSPRLDAPRFDAPTP